MGRNKTAGTIRKGSMVHTIYEAMITYPNEKFTSADIYDGLKKDYPNLKPATVVSTLNSRFVEMGIIKDTGDTRKSPAGRHLIVFQKNERAPQPLIHDPDATDRHGNGVKKKTRKPRKKAPEIPETIDATQLGSAIIDYVKHLQDRLSDAALRMKEMAENSSIQLKEKTRQISALTYQLDGMKKENENLRTKLANKSRGRTFDTKEVLDFKKRKAQQSGLGS